MCTCFSPMCSTKPCVKKWSLSVILGGTRQRCLSPPPRQQYLRYHLPPFPSPACMCQSWVAGEKRHWVFWGFFWGFFFFKTFSFITRIHVSELSSSPICSPGTFCSPHKTASPTVPEFKLGWDEASISCHFGFHSINKHASTLVYVLSHFYLLSWISLVISWSVYLFYFVLYYTEDLFCCVQLVSHTGDWTLDLLCSLVLFPQGACSPQPRIVTAVTLGTHILLLHFAQSPPLTSLVCPPEEPHLLSCVFACMCHLTTKLLPSPIDFSIWSPHRKENMQC